MAWPWSVPPDLLPLLSLPIFVGFALFSIVWKSLPFDFLDNSSSCGWQLLFSPFFHDLSLSPPFLPTSLSPLVSTFCPYPGYGLPPLIGCLPSVTFHHALGSWFSPPSLFFALMFEICTLHVFSHVPTILSSPRHFLFLFIFKRHGISLCRLLSYTWIIPLDSLLADRHWICFLCFEDKAGTGTGQTYHHHHHRNMRRQLELGTGGKRRRQAGRQGEGRQGRHTGKESTCLFSGCVTVFSPPPPKQTLVLIYSWTL